MTIFGWAPESNVLFLFGVGAIVLAAVLFFIYIIKRQEQAHIREEQEENKAKFQKVFGFDPEDLVSSTVSVAMAAERVVLEKMAELANEIGCEIQISEQNMEVRQSLKLEEGKTPLDRLKEIKGEVEFQRGLIDTAKKNFWNAFWAVKNLDQDYWQYLDEGFSAEILSWKDFASDKHKDS